MQDLFNSYSILNPVILILAGIFTYSFFLSIKKGRIEEERVLWLLPLIAVLFLVIYSLYGYYPGIIVPLFVVIFLALYVVMVKNV